MTDIKKQNAQHETFPAKHTIIHIPFCKLRLFYIEFLVLWLRLSYPEYTAAALGAHVPNSLI